jgi:hypothetical protein
MDGRAPKACKTDLPLRILKSVKALVGRNQIYPRVYCVDLSPSRLLYRKENRPFVAIAHYFRYHRR